MSYPLAQYGLLNVHSPVAPGLTLPPLKRISSRDSEAKQKWIIRFGDWLEGSLGNFVEDKTLFPKLLLLWCDDPIRFCTS
jgi:hypothetical protein